MYTIMEGRSILPYSKYSCALMSVIISSYVTK
jgi:hypothetical protein